MKKLKDVAELAGVSEGTASLVMNNRPGVNEQTRKRVQNAAKSLGYFPHTGARGLAMKKTHTIGLIVTDIENPFFGSVTRFIDEQAKQEGYSLILSVSNDELSAEEKIIHNFLGKRVDGVIVIPTIMPRTDFSCYKDLERHNIPFIFTTICYPGIECDFVMTDLEDGSYKLTKYLIELGHKKIIMLTTANREVLVSKFRIDGFVRAFQESGRNIDPFEHTIPCRKPDYFCGYHSAMEILKKDPPDAIIAINDILALGAKKAALELGYRIPEDISIAGYDDVIYSSISQIPLTTVKQNIPQLCRDTISILIERIKTGPTVSRSHVLLPPELIVRDSTGKCGR